MAKMDCWIIRRATDGEKETDHVIGYHYEGRVSSSIQEVIPEKRQVKTRSGRIYDLSSAPRTNNDAEYVWSQWASINGVISFKDVTEEYLSKFKEAVDAASAQQTTTEAQG
ncbi:MAG TPA: hypothetical protein VFM18_08795 [Methanosarcina sp.]|nr:hypothetical protein [Methanosarcina sp.]